MSVLLHRRGAISSTSQHRNVTSLAYYLAPGGNDSNPGTAAQPFATFAKAQSSMQSSSFKTVYLRSGVYNVTQQLSLTAADNGTTWAVYPGDAMNSAILDASGMTFSNCVNPNIILIHGGNDITINGLELRNFPNGGGITIHGGPAYPDFTWQGCQTYAATGVARRNIISNNIVHNLGFSAQVPPYCFAGIGTQGDVQNTLITNNALYDLGGIAIQASLLGQGPSHGIDNVVIQNNVAYNLNTVATGDSGGLYSLDRTGGTSVGVIFRNNFVRDYAGSAVNAIEGIYLDDNASNMTVTGNIIAGHGVFPFQYHTGVNNHVTGNIIDLSSAQSIMLYQNSGGAGGMSGNTFTNNIVISPGGGGGFYSGNGATFTLPTVNGNDYYNYAGSQISTSASGYTGYGSISDPSPSRVDPQISGWNYQIAAGSPVYSSPVNFPPIIGQWGPPGYQIPQTGTAPSSPHA
jgi:hypothetical protein